MTDHAWRDRIVGDRMLVDQEFAPRVRQSAFSNQEWSLIMTAVELELEGEGEAATIVADTSRIQHIMPELDRINQQLGAQSGGEDRGGGSLVGSLKSALGFGGGVDEEAVRQAEALAGEYASALEDHLREAGKWPPVVDPE